MKKFFAIALIGLVALSIQLLVPERVVLLDNDVGLYISPADQVSIDMPFIADNDVIMLTNPGSVLSGVENPVIMPTTLNLKFDLREARFRQSATANNETVLQTTSNLRDIGGLCTAEVFPWAGEKARHI